MEKQRRPLTATPGVLKALAIIRDWPTSYAIRPEWFARKYFPADHPSWRTACKCGRGTRHVSGLVLWAGGFLGKLRRAGLIGPTNRLSAKGRQLLREGLARADQENPDE